MASDDIWEEGAQWLVLDKLMGAIQMLLPFVLTVLSKDTPSVTAEQIQFLYVGSFNLLT